MGGGQRRTYNCPCGWGTQDSVRASDMKLKMHKKTCELARAENWGARPFEPTLNGMNGMQVNRRGHFNHVPLIANNMTLNNINYEHIIPVADALRMQEVGALVRAVAE